MLLQVSIIWIVIELTFSSVMQVMSGTDILHDLLDEPDTPPYHFEDMELRKQCPATDSDEVGELITAFRSLMRLLWIQKGGTITPRTLFTRIGMTNRQFMGYQQQDSHELLRVLLDALETEELTVGSISPSLTLLIRSSSTNCIPKLKSQGGKSDAHKVGLLFG